MSTPAKHWLPERDIWITRNISHISYITTETLLKLLAHVPNGKNGWQCYKHFTEWHHIQIIRRDIFETKKCQQKQNVHIRKEMDMADTENLIHVLRNVSRPNLKDSPIILEKLDST